jgi:hypothetical protein
MPSRRSLCPICRAEISHLVINAGGTPFLCPRCRQQICAPAYYRLAIMLCSMLAAAILASAVGLGGLSWFFAILVLWIPVNVLGLIVVKRYFPPRLRPYITNVLI